MAKSLVNAFKLNLHSMSNACFFFKNGPLLFPVRSLYASTTLGIDGFIQSREKTQHQFSHLAEKFRTKMNEFVQDSQNKNMIFTEDLKNMIHLAEADNSDVPLVIKMMKKFNQQNKELRFGSFVFGPVVMRMFYFLNKPEEALECFICTELQGFFDQLMTYQLLLDLLYENKKYEEMIQIFELIKSKQIQGTKYPKNIIVLVMAACYKQNTPESLKYALNLWAELYNVGHLPMRRAATFCAGLALNQGKPDVALEIVSTVRKQNYVTVRCLKAAALTEIGRIEEVLLVLKSVLEIDDPNHIKHTFLKEIIDRARTLVNKQGNASIKEDFARIEQHLQDQGLIIDDTLDNQLCSEIVSPPLLNNRSRYQSNTMSRYQQNFQKSNNFKIYRQRPGLRDIY